MYVNVCKCKCKGPVCNHRITFERTTSAKNIPFKYCFLIKVCGQANDKVVK